MVDPMARSSSMVGPMVNTMKIQTSSLSQMLAATSTIGSPQHGAPNGVMAPGGTALGINREVVGGVSLGVGVSLGAQPR